MADIVPISPEQADLRRAVRRIADKYGHMVPGSYAANRPDQPGDGAELRGQAQSQAAGILLRRLLTSSLA